MTGGTPSRSSSLLLTTWPVTGTIFFLFRATTRFHLGVEGVVAAGEGEAVAVAVAVGEAVSSEGAAETLAEGVSEADAGGIRTKGEVAREAFVVDEEIPGAAEVAGSADEERFLLLLLTLFLRRNGASERLFVASADDVAATEAAAESASQFCLGTNESVSALRRGLSRSLSAAEGVPSFGIGSCLRGDAKGGVLRRGDAVR